MFGINGAMPEVEITILDLLTPKPIGSVNILTALDTFFQLYKGSPCPMKTTLSIRLEGLIRRYWEMISGVERFFKSFWVPV